jgi:pentatricopeptide repeat protein
MLRGCRGLSSIGLQVLEEARPLNKIPQVIASKARAPKVLKDAHEPLGRLRQFHDKYALQPKQSQVLAPSPDHLKLDQYLSSTLLERLHELQMQMNANKTQIRLLDEELDANIQEKLGKTRMQELISKKNELSQHGLKVIGKQFGELLVEASCHPLIEPSIVRKIFDGYVKFFSPTAFHFNALINSYGKAGLLDLFSEVVGEMEAFEVDCDKMTYRKIIQFLCADSRYSDTEMWLARMLNAGISPTFQVLDSVALCAVKAENFPACMKHVHRILEMGKCVSAETLRHVLVAAVQSKLLLEWQKLEDKMLFPKMMISNETVNLLLRFYCKRGMLSRCEHILKSLEYKRFDFDPEVQYMLVSSEKQDVLGCHGYGFKFSEYFRKMYAKYSQNQENGMAEISEFLEHEDYSHASEHTLAPLSSLNTSGSLFSSNSPAI